MELVSDGSLTLMRAIDSFDIHRGNRFSTYATFSLMKGFAQTGVKTITHRQPRSLETSALEALPNRSSGQFERFEAADDVTYLLGALSNAERRVVRSLFGIGVRTSNSANEIASRLGVSPARVRQIEKSAMAKMRLSASNCR